MRMDPISQRAARALAAAALVAIGGTVAAQPRDAAPGFPSQPVRIVVQSGPGGPPDIRARQIATKLQALWGQPVIVENRPGASGLLALDAAAKSPPDGHALVLSGQASFVVAPHLRKLPFDPLKDFVPVTQVGISPLILMVNPALPVHSVAELVAYAKRHPGELNATHPGPGTTNHLALLLFERATGVKTVQVPYRDGVGAAIIDLAAGRIDLAFDLFTSHGAYLKDGRLRPLAVSGRERLAVLPDVPTFREAGIPEIESVLIWSGVFVRAGTPEPVVHQLQRALASVLRLPDVRAAIIDAGGRPIGNTPEEFAAVIRSEYARYGKLIGEAGLRLD